MVIFTITLSFFGCKDKTTDPAEEGQAEGYTLVKGKVIDMVSNLGIDSAYVRIIGSKIDSVAFTNANGEYSVNILLDNSEDLTVIGYKNNYENDTVTAFVTVGKPADVPVLRLKSTGNNEIILSGPPASISLTSASPNNINVKESGGIETSSITFQVYDSSGYPINIINAVTVNFKLANVLGGEFLSPLSAKSDKEGKVNCFLTSGTRAGIVQLYAEINQGTNKIISKPVYISIHGGLPDVDHFSLGPSAFNFPGLDIYGEIDPISVIVGDKFGNPVKPNTAIYFTTSGGIIVGSLLTDAEGRGTVNLISGNPEPNHPSLGPGFATITATTSNENMENISKSTVVLFSGAPFITVTPTSLNVSNNGSQAFTFKVADRYGNPLSSDNKISVSVEGEGVGVQGDIDITLPDTQSKAWTQFGFTVYDKDSTNTLKPITLKIKSDGPNGKAFYTITGTGY